MPVIKQPREDFTPTWLRYPGVMVRARRDIHTHTFVNVAQVIPSGTLGVFLGNRTMDFRTTVSHDKRGNPVNKHTTKKIGTPAFYFGGKAVNIPLNMIHHLEYVPTKGDGVPRTGSL